jgi:prophage regulatory protein
MTKPKRILRLPEVESRTGLKRDSVYRLAKLGQFPRPFKISAWASGWLESEIDAYIDACIAARAAQSEKPTTN